MPLASINATRLAEQLKRERKTMDGWRSMDSAPRDGTWVLLLLGETIPTAPDIRTAQWLEPDVCEELGEHECEKYGGWIIWNTCADWFVVRHDAPLGWAECPARQRLPAPPESET